MADAATENVAPPFTAFNFRIDLKLRGADDVLCSAAFTSCDGLELSIEPKTIREGGNNNRPINLIGPAKYGQLSLKRGMTDSFDLWDWFERVLRREKAALRASCEVVMLAVDRKTEQARFVLEGCMPVKLKAPGLSAKDGQLAIEELVVAYELLSLKRPET